MRHMIFASAAAALIAVGAQNGFAQTASPGQAGGLAAHTSVESGLKAGQTRLSDFFGGDLESSDGRQIGEVEDVILEGSRIVAAIIRIEQDLGLGERSVSVPFEALRRDGERVVVDMTADQVRSLPAVPALDSMPDEDEVPANRK